MENEMDVILRKFYKAMKDSLLREGLKGSLFKTLILKKNSIKIQSVLRDATLSTDSFSPSVLKRLASANYVLQTDIVDQYIISAKGIWEIESNLNIISLETLFDFYNEKVFRFKMVEEDLIPREKVVVFSLLASRAFSKESAVNLNKSETVFETWKKIVAQALEKLTQIGELPEDYSISEFYNITDGKRPRKGKSGNLVYEEPIMYIFRRIYELPEKTKNLVKNPGNRQYYVDLIKGDDLYQEGFKFLIKKVFQNVNLTYNNLESIASFFDDISFRFGPILFDSGTNPYLTPIFSEKIKDTLLFNVL